MGLPGPHHTDPSSGQESYRRGSAGFDVPGDRSPTDPVREDREGPQQRPQAFPHVLPQAVSFILKPSGATELPLTPGGLDPGRTLLGAAWEAQALLSGRPAPPAARRHESATLSGPWFPIGKMGTILLG